MNQTELEKAVAAHPFFSGLKEDRTRLLADSAIRIHFDRDQVIFREGETANRFYHIEIGTVALVSVSGGAEPVTIDVINGGELPGWSWLFPPYVWQFTARATEPTAAIFFYGTVLRECCESDQALCLELL